MIVEHAVTVIYTTKLQQNKQYNKTGTPERKAVRYRSENRNRRYDDEFKMVRKVVVRALLP